MVETRSQKLKATQKKPKVVTKKPKQVNRYNTWVSETRKHALVSEKTMQITRKGRKQMDIDELEGLYGGLRKNKADSKYVIRILNGHRWFTIKGYEEEDLNIMSFEEYYQNKVKETGKFEMISQIEITMMTAN
jgi:hypothetical protein